MTVNTTNSDIGREYHWKSTELPAPSSLEDTDELLVCELPSRTRLRPLRHCIGFRGYNGIFTAEAEISSRVSNIRCLLNRQFWGVQSAIDQAESALQTLRQREKTFYDLSDCVMRYDSKIKELDYLKANIEHCIKDSVVNVLEKLDSVGTAQPTSVFVTKCKALLTHPPLDYNDYCVQVNELKQLVYNSTVFSASFGDIGSEIEAKALTLITTAEQCVKARQVQSKVKQIVMAHYDLSEMNGLLANLAETERMLTKRVVVDHALASVFLSISLNVQTASNALKIRTEVIERGFESMPRRDLVAEEQMLHSFIMDGQKYERDRQREERNHQSKFRKNLELPTSPYTPRTTINPRTPRRPRTPATPNTPTAPVWALAWNEKTKVLKSIG